MNVRIGFDGYVIDPINGIVYGPLGRPVGSRDTSGYLQIDGRTRGLGIRSAHRLIWQAAVGPIPDGMEINHRNGVKTDNRLSNLELVTHQENIQHAYTTGLKSNAGERHPSHRLTAADVREIRSLYVRNSKTHGARALAERYGVGRKCIADVVIGHTWRTV